MIASFWLRGKGLFEDAVNIKRKVKSQNALQLLEKGNVFLFESWEGNSCGNISMHEISSGLEFLTFFRFFFRFCNIFQTVRHYLFIIRSFYFKCPLWIARKCIKNTFSFRYSLNLPAKCSSRCKTSCVNIDSCEIVSFLIISNSNLFRTAKLNAHSFSQQQCRGHRNHFNPSTKLMHHQSIVNHKDMNKSCSQRGRRIAKGINK